MVDQASLCPPRMALGRKPLTKPRLRPPPDLIVHRRLVISGLYDELFVVDLLRIGAEDCVVSAIGTIDLNLRIEKLIEKIEVLQIIKTMMFKKI